MILTESNTGDEGANEKQSIIMKFIQGGRSRKKIDNTKVNTDTPVAKQRGAKFVILDVTHLKLDDQQKIEFLGAIANFYESNFWINFKSVGLVAWLTLALAKSLMSYIKYGAKENPVSHWKSRLF